MKILKNIAFAILPKQTILFLKRMKLGYLLVTSKNSYLIESGYVDSCLEKKLKDHNNQYIPWMNYPFIEFLKDKLTKDLVVFEYGSGSSSVFFAKRTKKIVSVEYDKEWYQKMKSIIETEVNNGFIHLQELNASYPDAIKNLMANEKCDIVVIDGRKRVKCAKASFPFLSEKGILIFDDSHREYYSEGIEFYKSKGFKSINFKGIKPTGFQTFQTTLLYKDGNCLGI